MRRLLQPNRVSSTADTDTKNQQRIRSGEEGMLHSPWQNIEFELAFRQFKIEVHRYHWSTMCSEPGWMLLPDAAHLNMAVVPRPSDLRVGLGVAAQHRLREAGSLFVVPPNVEFYAAPPETEMHCRTIVCLISRDFLCEAGALSHLSDDNLNECLNISSLKIRGGLGRMMAEVCSPGFASAALLEAMGTEVAIELARYLQKFDSKPMNAGGLPGWRMRRLRARIETDDLPPPNLSELAGLTGLSVRQLMRAYVAETGQSLGRHIQQVNIDRAKKMLLDPANSIKQIAFQLGFAAPGSFSQAFHLATGTRPSDFRRHNMS